MNVERHYDEDALVTMLDARVLESDAHLANCGECAERLEDFRLVTESLRDAATWDQREVTSAPNPNTIATLRAFADTMAAEDAAARSYLTELLAGPRETWMANLNAHPEWRTAGVVRGLIAAAERAIDSMPADAVAITQIATAVSDGLSPNDCADGTLARLRGGAWREHAYALFYTGSYAEAERAILTAEKHFVSCAVNEYELARLDIVRTLVDRGLEHFDTAHAASERSAAHFSRFADWDRMCSAKLAQVHLKYSARDFGAAMTMLLALERHVEASQNAQTHALVLGNLGYCAWKLDRPGDAIRYHEASAALLDVLGMKGESVRARWTVASILASQGALDEALARFASVRDEFERLGMTSAATDAAMELAELLVIRGAFESVEGIARQAMSTLDAAGLAHTSRALTAVSLLQECAQNRTATPELVRSVRAYLRRLPNEPELLFAPPPP